jgi:hypothetical protein
MGLPRGGALGPGPGGIKSVLSSSSSSFSLSEPEEGSITSLYASCCCRRAAGWESCVGSGGVRGVSERSPSSELRLLLLGCRRRS